MTSFDYVKPKDLKEAIDLIQKDGVWPIAGGTNLLVDIRERSLRPKEVVNSEAHAGIVRHIECF